MILEKGLGKEFWAEAVNTTVYILNRTGTSSQEGKTPLRHTKFTSINVQSGLTFVHSAVMRMSCTKTKKEGKFEK